jgi:autotransporter-associated beta strand protein
MNGPAAWSINVNNTEDTITSVLNNAANGVTINGSGTLALYGLSTFTNKITINNPKVQFNTIGNVGAATGSSFGKPSTHANGQIQIGSGANTSTLEFTNASAAGSTDRQVQVGSSSGVGGATILNNNTDPAYSLTFTTNAFNVAVSTTSGRTLTLGGANTGNNQIQGAIINNTGGGNLSLVKSGSGTWSLLGINTFTGTVLISDGTLDFGGANGSVNANTGIVNNGILKVSRTNAPTQGNPSNIGMFNRQPIQGTGSLVEDGGSTGSLTLKQCPRHRQQRCWRCQ